MKNKVKERQEFILYQEQKKHFTMSCVGNALKIVGIFESKFLYWSEKKKQKKKNTTTQVKWGTNTKKMHTDPRIRLNGGSTTWVGITLWTIYNINAHTHAAPKSNCANATPMWRQKERGREQRQSERVNRREKETDEESRDWNSILIRC